MGRLSGSAGHAYELLRPPVRRVGRVIAFVGGGGVRSGQPEPAQPAKARSPASVVTVSKPAQRRFHGVGRVPPAASTRRDRRVQARVAGSLNEIHFKMGSRFSSDLLVRHRRARSSAPGGGAPSFCRAYQVDNASSTWSAASLGRARSCLRSRRRRANLMRERKRREGATEDQAAAWSFHSQHDARPSPAHRRSKVTPELVSRGWLRQQPLLTTLAARIRSTLLRRELEQHQVQRMVEAGRCGAADLGAPGRSAADERGSRTGPSWTSRHSSRPEHRQGCAPAPTPNPRPFLAQHVARVRVPLGAIHGGCAAR